MGMTRDGNYRGFLGSSNQGKTPSLKNSGTSPRPATRRWRFSTIFVPLRYREISGSNEFFFICTFLTATFSRIASLAPRRTVRRITETERHLPLQIRLESTLTCRLERIPFPEKGPGRPLKSLSSSPSNSCCLQVRPSTSPPCETMCADDRLHSFQDTAKTIELARPDKTQS